VHVDRQSTRLLGDAQLVHSLTDAGARPATGPRELRRRVSRFLHASATGRHALRITLSRLAQPSWEPVIFGGVPRDLAVYAGSVVPRDVDIVLESVGSEEIANELADLVKRRNRFGGVKLVSDGWRFDVWPLSETWAFRAGLVPLNGVDSLAKTTFLNVEAVAVQLKSHKGRGRRVFEQGFFDAVAQRKLDINLEDNPFPALCVVRSLLTAARLQFVLAPRLLRYIAHYSRISDIDGLLEVQDQHYGGVRRFAEEMRFWISSIHRHVHRNRNTELLLPQFVPVQLDFWSASLSGWDDFDRNPEAHLGPPVVAR